MATLVTRSGKGSPLTHAEVDANFTNLNTDKLELSGGTMTGNLSFGDNDKAIFGAGSDLQIYHTGSQSFIRDVGTGDLRLCGDDLQLRNAATNERYVSCVSDGAVTLYYDNLAKLATTSTGVDITGTLTSDGLTVDGTSAIELVSGKTVTTPHTDYNLLLDNGSDTEFVIRLDSVFSGSIGSSHIKQISEGTNRGALVFATENGSGGTVPDRLKIDYNGDISFYEDTGTTAKFFWDASAERLGIGDGTNTPPRTLHLKNDVPSIRLTDSTANDYAEVVSTDGDLFLRADHGNTHAGSRLSLQVDGTDALYIDDSLNVGIGTTSPSSYHANADNLVIQDSGNAGITIATTDSAYFSQINFADGTSGAQAYTGILRYAHSDNSLRIIVNTGEKMRIDSSGNVGIGTSSSASGGSIKLNVNGSSGGGIQLTSNNNGGSAIIPLTAGGQSFYTFTGAIGSETYTERMRIDSSGNLLVGTTDTSTATQGVKVRADLDAIAAVADGGISGFFGRLNSDGEIVRLRKDGTTVGSIAAKSGEMYLGSANTGVRFYDAGDAITPFDVTGATGRDNAIDIGVSSTRFKDLYLSGGVYLGGTGSANKLDDYEEGTWTPSDGSGAGLTFSSASGTYTKIGRMVFVSYAVTYPATSDTTDMAIDGLPFTPHTNFRFGVAQSYTSNSVAGDAQVTTVDTDIVYRKNGTATKFVNSELSGVALRGSFSYETS